MHFFTKNFHFIALSPLFSLTIFFIIGIIWHTALILFLIIFSLFFCYYFTSYNKRFPLSHQLILCSLCACAGAWLHQKELYDYDNFYTFTNDKPISITGTIIDQNEVINNYKKSTAITLAIDTITTNDCTKKSNKLLLLYTKNNNDFTVGDTVTFFNIQCKKPSSESFQRYQIKEQVVATVFEDNLKYTITHHPTWSLRYWIWNQKKRILDGLSHKLSQKGFRFFSSLFLGNRMCIKAALEETNEQFKTWGISHFLARSGLHLALFIYIWQVIFCIIPLPLIIKQIIISLLSCIYFILTWTSAPFTRSFALFILNKLCLFTKTSFNLLHYLTLVCLGFLLYSPLYLFFLDFQLSFTLTFALAWLSQLSLKQQN
jgi:competence protein ComEC